MSVSLPIKSEAIPCIVVHELPQRLANDAEDPLLFHLKLFPTTLSPTAFVLPFGCDGVFRWGCVLGMGDADLEAKGVVTGDAIRRLVAFTGSNATSSPSSRPEISLGALGRSDDLPGVELVLPCWLMFMAGRTA